MLFSGMFAIIVLGAGMMIRAYNSKSAIIPPLTETLTPINKNQIASKKKMVVAYVIDKSDEIPDPKLVTHIYYAFGNITPSYDSLSIPNLNKFRKIVALKDSNPDLKVCLSIQTKPRDGFAVMTASDSLRSRFVSNCKRIVEEYNLDGVDLDWEFPGTDMGMHKGGGQDDPFHYSLLARDLRQALGDGKQLSFYSNNAALYNDLKLMLPYVDFVMMSGYNIGTPPKQHQCNLYPSEICGDWAISKCLEAHLNSGVPKEKILLGIPFFVRTQKFRSEGNYFDRPYFDKYIPGYKLKWDNKAKASYYADDEGRVFAAFDTPKSIKEKCKFIKDKELAGAFYWHYDGDMPDHSLAKSVRNNLKK